MSSSTPRIRETLNGTVSDFVGKYGGTPFGKLLLLLPALLVLAFLLFVPTLFILSESLTTDAGGITLAHYARALTDGYYQTVVVRTLRVAAVVTLLDFLLGFPLAYAAVRGGRFLGGGIVIATLAPLSVDLIIRTYGWYVLLGQGGLVTNALVALGVGSPSQPPRLLFNEIGIIVGLVHVLLPFMVFPIMTVLHTIPYEYEEAARNLGANRAGVFAHVLFPLALPGIAAGTLLVFTNSVAAYVTPAILGGSVQTLAVTITETFSTTSDWGLGSALAMVLVVLALVVIVLYQHSLERAGGTVGGDV